MRNAEVNLENRVFRLYFFIADHLYLEVILKERGKKYGKD